MTYRGLFSSSCTLFIAILALSRSALAIDLRATIEKLETSTLVEWSQNMRQTCGRKGCAEVEGASHTQNLLFQELQSRFQRETGDSLESISIAQWTALLSSKSEGERCRLLRTAFILSLEADPSPGSPSWRLFTHQRPLSLLTQLGHRPSPGKSPLCPDYFFPESDVLEQALSRGERLFNVSPATPQETLARITTLQARYLSRGSAQRKPNS